MGGVRPDRLAYWFIHYHLGMSSPRQKSGGPRRHGSRADQPDLPLTRCRAPIDGHHRAANSRLTVTIAVRLAPPLTIAVRLANRLIGRSP